MDARQELKGLLTGLIVLLGSALGPVIQNKALVWPQDYIVAALFLGAIALKYFVIEPMMPKKNGNGGQ